MIQRRSSYCDWSWTKHGMPSTLITETKSANRGWRNVCYGKLPVENVIRVDCAFAPSLTPSRKSRPLSPARSP
jgi:hypothetical protein